MKPLVIEKAHRLILNDGLFDINRLNNKKDKQKFIQIHNQIDELIIYLEQYEDEKINCLSSGKREEIGLKIRMLNLIKVEFNNEMTIETTAPGTLFSYRGKVEFFQRLVVTIKEVRKIMNREFTNVEERHIYSLSVELLNYLGLEKKQSERKFLKYSI